MTHWCLLQDTSCGCAGHMMLAVQCFPPVQLLAVQLCGKAGACNPTNCVCYFGVEGWWRGVLTESC
jgi:hypothetical protein